MVNPDEKVVIVIDRDNRSRYDNRDTLKREGFFTICSDNLCTAKQYCAKYYPDLLLIGDGFSIDSLKEFCQKIKFSRPKTKIVISTSLFEISFLNLYLKNLIDDFLQPPYSRIELIARIQKLLLIIPEDSYIRFHNLKLNVKCKKLLMKDLIPLVN